MKKYAYVYDIHFKILIQTKGCVALVDNKAGATLCVLGDNERE